VLFDKVCEHLNLLEKDYFGLTYRDTENQKVIRRTATDCWYVDIRGRRDALHTVSNSPEVVFLFLAKFHR